MSDPTREQRKADIATARAWRGCLCHRQKGHCAQCGCFANALHEAREQVREELRAAVVATVQAHGVSVQRNTLLASQGFELSGKEQLALAILKLLDPKEPGDAT